MTNWYDGTQSRYQLGSAYGDQDPATHTSYVVPPPSAPFGTTRYLREDGNWIVPAGSAGELARVVLAQTYTTDITGGITSANTWTQILTPLSFDTALSSSVILVAIRGNIQAALTPGTATGVAARVRIDGVGDYPFAGSDAPVTTGLPDPGTTYVNALAGAGTVVIGELAAGSHELTIDLWADGDLSYNCRCASRFPIESLGIVIVEVPISS